jgi:hypothetical protein
MSEISASEISASETEATEFGYLIIDKSAWLLHKDLPLDEFAKNLEHAMRSVDNPILRIRLATDQVLLINGSRLASACIAKVTVRAGDTAAGDGWPQVKFTNFVVTVG